MHIFSYKKNIEGGAVFEYTLEELKWDDVEYQYQCKLIRRFTSDRNVSCEQVEGKMDTDDDNAGTKHVKSTSELHENIAREFREQGLELLNKRRCFDANYAQMHPKDDAYYNTKDINAMQKFRQDGISLVFPDLLKMNGF